MIFTTIRGATRFPGICRPFHVALNTSPDPPRSPIQSPFSTNPLQSRRPSDWVARSGSDVSDVLACVDSLSWQTNSQSSSQLISISDYYGYSINGTATFSPDGVIASRVKRAGTLEYDASLVYCLLVYLSYLYWTGPKLAPVRIGEPVSRFWQGRQG